MGIHPPAHVCIWGSQADYCSPGCLSLFCPGGGTESPGDAFLDNGGQSRAQKPEFKWGIKEGETDVGVLYFRHIY